LTADPGDSRAFPRVRTSRSCSAPLGARGDAGQADDRVGRDDVGEFEDERSVAGAFDHDLGGDADVFDVAGVERGAEVGDKLRHWSGGGAVEHVHLQVPLHDE
jgi:hypothetical protein